MPRDMSADDLRRAQAAHDRAAKSFESTRKERNALVIIALAEGWTHAAIAEATGLSRGRISQIAVVTLDSGAGGAHKQDDPDAKRKGR